MNYLDLDTASIAILVRVFYDDVRGDEQLAPVFHAALGMDWEPHLDRMVDFWSAVMLGAKGFQGNVYGKHMALEGVTPAHVDRWLSLFEMTTYRLFRPDVAAGFHLNAQRIATSLQLGFLDRARR